MGIGSKLGTLRRLGSSVRRAGMVALPTLTAIGLALRTLGYARTSRWLDRTPVQSPSSRRPIAGRRAASTKTIAAGVLLAARVLPWRPACLERSMALSFLLRRRGHPARVCIGVRKRESVASAIEAHAWVEVDGEVVGDHPDVHQRFLPLDEAQAPLAAELARLPR